MPRLRDILKKAEQDGRGAGANSAMWYYDRSEPTRENLLKVLKGMDDGDPEILDTFVSGSLSGEWADDMTPKRLYEELDMNDKQIEVASEEVCDAWEAAFNSAYADQVRTET